MVFGCNGNGDTPSTSSEPTYTAETPTPVPTEIVTPPPTPTRTEPAFTETPYVIDGPVSIEMTSDKLIITNNTSATVYYYVFVKAIVGLIDWFPCENPEQCARLDKIEAGKSIEKGLTENKEDLIVYWWQLEQHPDQTWYADTTHEIVIEVQPNNQELVVQ